MKHLSKHPDAIYSRHRRASDPAYRLRDIAFCERYRARKLKENPRYEAERKAAWRARKKANTSPQPETS